MAAIKIHGLAIIVLECDGVFHGLIGFQKPTAPPSPVGKEDEAVNSDRRD